MHLTILKYFTNIFILLIYKIFESSFSFESCERFLLVGSVSLLSVNNGLLLKYYTKKNINNPKKYPNRLCFKEGFTFVRYKTKFSL